MPSIQKAIAIAGLIFATTQFNTTHAQTAAASRTVHLQNGKYSLRDTVNNGSKEYIVDVDFTGTMIQIKGRDRYKIIYDLVTVIAEEIKKQNYEVVFMGHDPRVQKAIVNIRYGNGQFDPAKMETALKAYSEAELDAIVTKAKAEEKAKNDAAHQAYQDKQNEIIFYRDIKIALELNTDGPVGTGPLSDKERTEMTFIRDAVQKIGYLKIPPAERTQIWRATERMRYTGDSFLDPGTDEMRKLTGYEKGLKEYADVRAMLEKKLSGL